MEPIEFTDEQRAILPPHRAIVWAKDQPEYQPLPSVALEGEEGRSISRWTFTPEERARIAAGEDLYLEQLTFGGSLQPILPTVGLRFAPVEALPQQSIIAAALDMRAALSSLAEANQVADAAWYALRATETDAIRAREKAHKRYLQTTEAFRDAVLGRAAPSDSPACRL